MPLFPSVFGNAEVAWIWKPGKATITRMNGIPKGYFRADALIWRGKLLGLCTLEERR